MSTMLRLAKPEGKYNLILEEVPIPEPGPGEIRIKSVRSLISRGSEMGARYTREHAVAPEAMGYSLAGVVDQVGPGIDHLAEGDRVVSLSPHAQYVIAPAQPGGPGDQMRIVALPDAVDFDRAPYYPLVGGAVAWVDIEEIGRDDNVVVLGQGLVGSLVLQVALHNGQGRLLAVDALENRCRLAAELGAEVVDAASITLPITK